MYDKNFKIRIINLDIIGINYSFDFFLQGYVIFINFGNIIPFFSKDGIG